MYSSGPPMTDTPSSPPPSPCWSNTARPHGRRRVLLPAARAGRARTARRRHRRRGPRIRPRLNARARLRIPTPADISSNARRRSAAATGPRTTPSARLRTHRHPRSFHVLRHPHRARSRPCTRRPTPPWCRPARRDRQFRRPPSSPRRVPKPRPGRARDGIRPSTTRRPLRPSRIRRVAARRFGRAPAGHAHRDRPGTEDLSPAASGRTAAQRRRDHPALSVPSTVGPLPCRCRRAAR